MQTRILETKDWESAEILAEEEGAMQERHVYNLLERTNKQRQHQEGTATVTH